MSSFLLLAPAGCGPQQAAGGLDWMPSHEELLSRAAESHRPVMIAFFNGWSDWCRRLEEETLADPRVREELTPFLLFRVEVEEGQALAGQYVVLSCPSLVFLNSRGEEIYRVTGYRDPEQLLREVKAALRAAGM